MKRSTLYFPVVSVLSLSFLAPASAAAEGQDRFALFQLGAGPGLPSYPSELEAVMSLLESVPGVDRLKLALDLGLGLAVSPKGFVMARIDATGDRLDDGADYIQVNLYLASLGFRYYPSVRGFYVEGNLGASSAVIQSSFLNTSRSDPGVGFGGALGYDFARRATGFGLTVEGRYNYLSIEGDPCSQLMATLNLCWK